LQRGASLAVDQKGTERWPTSGERANTGQTLRDAAAPYAPLDSLLGTNRMTWDIEHVVDAIAYHTIFLLERDLTWLLNIDFFLGTGYT